jgi:anti-sigma regulatory factor (Ser/Thr protein kinase)
VTRTGEENLRPAALGGRELVVARVNKTFPAQPAALQQIRAFIRERASKTSFYPDVAEDLVLAVSEACANSVRHSRSPAIEVSWRRTGDGAEVEVQDDGVFEARDALPAAGLGYGIVMMKALVDEVVIEEGTGSRPGTRVKLVMRERSGPPSSPTSFARR